MAHSTALASLTATYTDSEGEDDAKNEELERTPQSKSSVEYKSANSSRQNSPVPVRVTTKVSRLVSYIDDTVASDDDGDAPKHEVVVWNEEEDKNEDSPSEDEVQIPPEPMGSCSMDVVDKIGKLYEKMQEEQLDMNALIQKRKDFRNPSIYEKLISYCSINELGTNYPPSIYDPMKWDKESYYEELAKVQKTEMDRREKERKLKLDLVPTSKKLDDDKKRKSKWDQPGGNLGGQSIKPAGLVQPSLTTSATGTKGTVISAFGSLPKKPRP